MSPAFDPTLATGSLFQGKYEVSALAGAGRFGAVYRARQLSTGQDVAIKLLRTDPSESSDDVRNRNDRFRREMHLCAGLSHPNIVRLIDSGESEGGVLYAVFEHLPGSTLREVLTAEGRLAPAEALHLMAQVLDALSCAHARGVVHRDLKPENIMVTRTGARRNALVLDFGLGGLTPNAEGWALPRLTGTHEMMGTPCYAAPEQLRGEPLSARSDLYSWGLVFLESLTGEIAVDGTSGHEVILNQLGPEPIRIPSWLRARRLGRLLEIVTAKPVEQRDVTAQGLLEALGQIERGEIAADAGARQSLPEGERRQVTVVSCRLSVTPLGRRGLDVDEIDDLIHAQHAAYGEIAARAGGQVASVLADRVLLVFGHPRAREDDAQRAARTALRIREEAARVAERLATERALRLEVRIGVHTGVVVVREMRRATYQGLYDLVGLTPDIAARLDERAGAGEVLISGDTHRLLRDELTVEPAGQLRPWEAAVIPVLRLTGEAPHGGLETVVGARETPLVGRTSELGRLFATWERAKGGRPAAVLVSGEPGIGKSRLVRELRRRVPRDGWLEGRCVAENQQSPLRPIVDLLLATGEPIAALLSRHDFALAETLPLFTTLLGLPPDPSVPPLQVSPDRQKELTLGAILSLLLRIAQEHPLVLALEDLHWADPTTLDLATQLVQEVQSAQVVAPGPPTRLCVLFTARPEFSPPWSHDAASLVQLARLEPQDVEEMIAVGLAAGQSLAGTLLDRVVRQSDGVPLFVEEVTRVLIESGALAESQAVGAPSVEIPGSLRDLLTARLDRLSSSARDTSQLAAVLGREFRFDILRAVARKDSLLREDVRELTDAGLVYARRSARTESYLFKHALVRDAAYESLTRSRRRLLHGQVASTLRQRFPEVEEQQPELLAQHFESGGDAVAAVAYWQRAGDRGLKRAAYAEALQQLQRGLALLEAMRPSPERSRQEIELLTLLGTVQFSVQGAGTEEVERTFARARHLCDELGEEVPIKILSGLMIVPYVRGDREATAELLPRFRRLLERADEPVACITGRAVLGQIAFWSGDFVAARDHLEVGTRLYQTEEFQRFAREYGWDGGLFCHAYLMTSLFNLGYPDRAETVLRDLTTLAEATRSPYSILLALSYSSALMYDRGETEALLETCDKIIALSTEQKIYPWLAGGLCGRGAALVARGAAEEGLPQIQQGLALYLGMGIRCSYSYYLTYLAAAQRAAGNTAEALAAVDEGLSLCETLFARFHESELLRLKAEVLEGTGEVVNAEAMLRRAVGLAHERQARSLELRAATSLASLLQRRGRGDEARAVLAPVYGWFTEGFETADLRRARAVLGETT